MGRQQLITQKQAGEILGLSDRTIRTMISDGRLRGYRIDASGRGGKRAIRLRLDEVENSLVPIGGEAA